jgi:putative ABC transport system substrate-binding protein
MAHIHGRDINYERGCASKRAQLMTVAHDLVQRGPAVIVAIGAEALQAAMEVTATIPIVMLAPHDPRPGSGPGPLQRPVNLTGVSLNEPEPARRRLEILKELAPALTRVGVLWNPEDAGATWEVKGLLAAAGSLGLTLEPKEVRDPEEIDAALIVVALSQVQGLVVTLDALTYATRHRIAEFAAASRLPAIYPTEDFVRTGGLVAYGPRFRDVALQVGAYVDKVLRHAKPADLPIEQPTKLELIINLKTARALALTIPPSLLLRADQVID